MLGTGYKRAVLAALRATPDYSQLEVFRKFGEADVAKALRWLDQSGLSFYLLSRLREDSAQSCLPPHLLDALEQRLKANRARTNEWLRDFQIINEALTEGNVRFVVLKGFALVPDFCPRFELRHQADIDLWVEHGCVEEALSRLAQRGFTPRMFGPGQHVSLAGAGEERVSLNESIYRPGRFRRLELHGSLLEEAIPINMQYPEGQWERARRRVTGDISFFSLAPADMFIHQAHHAFKHLLSYWARPSWLYEIARFLDSTHANDSLWTEVCDSIGENAPLRDSVGMIVHLVEQLFAPRVSPIFAARCLRSLPAEIIVWNRYFGERVVLSSPMGNKVALLIQERFIKDPAVWSNHFWQRLFPVRSDLALTEICGKTLAPTFADRWNQFRFTLRKARFHGMFLFAYPFHALRWRFLRASGAQG
jgi:hypothetical protein